MRSISAGVFLLAGLALAACNGATTSVAIPAASPWNAFTTFLGSPYGDLTVVTVGSDISASIDNLGQFAVCTSDEGGFYAECNNLDCTPPGPADECSAQAPGGTTNVDFSGQLSYGYGLIVDLNRPAFTAGGVQLQSATAGTVGAISVTVGGGSTLNIGAGFSEGLIPGPAVGNLGPLPAGYVDDFTLVAFSPDWADFGAGVLCTDGTTTSCNPNVSPDGVAAFCDDEFVAFRTDGSTGPLSVLCGSVTVNINVNPPFNSVGQCISTLKAQNCGGLKGNAKAACNHAQIGVCHATFNVPSAHNPN